MAINTPNANDRRVRRTRQVLLEAFISLILERGYDAVTIRDVVKRAGVGRSTFYTHFGDLEELLVERGSGNWLREFAGCGSGPRRPLGFTLPFLEHAHENRRLWRALVGKRGGAAVKKRFRQSLLEVVREDVAALAGKQPVVVLDGIAHYVTGAFMELLFWWLDLQAAMAPTEIDKLFHRLTAPALEAVARRARPSGVTR
jgi:AcrR family transcriptional regulator